MILTYSIRRINKRIVDSNDVDVIVLNCVAENNTTNSTEAVDSNLYWCHVAKAISVGVSKCIFESVKRISIKH